MKRILATILVGCLALSVNLANAAATIKAGDTCPKLGKTFVENGYKYFCVKKTNKLIWSKGVPFVEPVRIIKYPDAPTSFDDLIANYKGISYAAWSKSSAAITAATDTAPAYKGLTGPNTMLAFKNPSSVFNLISRLYSGYKSSTSFTVLSFSYDDRDWAQEQMRQLQPNSNYPWITTFACTTRATCWGGGVFTDEKANVLLVLTTEILDDNRTSGTLEAHEFTHVVQQSQMGGTQPWPTTGPWPPTWYLEGQAEFSQHAAVYYQSFDLYSKNRRSVSDELFTDSTITSSWIQEFFLVEPPSSWFNKYASWRQYDLGGMFIEVLTALKGPNSTMEVWKLGASGLKFTDAFEKVYGTSFDKALPIISKAIALELGRS